MAVASIKALQADGYGAVVRAGRDEADMRAAVNMNLEHLEHVFKSAGAELASVGRHSTPRVPPISRKIRFSDI